MAVGVACRSLAWYIFLLADALLLWLMCRRRCDLAWEDGLKRLLLLLLLLLKRKELVTDAKSVSRYSIPPENSLYCFLNLPLKMAWHVDLVLCGTGAAMAA